MEDDRARSRRISLDPPAPPPPLRIVCVHNLGDGLRLHLSKIASADRINVTAYQNDEGETTAILNRRKAMALRDWLDKVIAHMQADEGEDEIVA
jgi:hypothetical protein